jgi:hypothetical protein
VEQKSRLWISVIYFCTQQPRIQVKVAWEEFLEQKIVMGSGCHMGRTMTISLSRFNPLNTANVQLKETKIFFLSPNNPSINYGVIPASCVVTFLVSSTVFHLTVCATVQCNESAAVM